MVEKPHGKGYQSATCVNGETHKWQPLSFVFETQLLDPHGRVQIRQPAIQEGRVYCVCMGCAHHTYIETDWVGYYLGGSEHGKEEQ
jgi:hypothetical protein